MITNKKLKKRIIEISYKHKLSHLGSCLTAVDIIEKIYRTKEDDDVVILSQGHAGLALYVVLEKINEFKINWKEKELNGAYFNAEWLLKKQGIHPSRKHGLINKYIDCSTGSLGQGLPIAVGMALGNKNRIVNCIISDGECAEGSIWEAFNIIENLELDNLRIFLNLNGWSGNNIVSKQKLLKKIKAYNVKIDIWDTNVDYLDFLFGLDGHYKVMNEEEYNLAMEVLK